MVEECDEGVFVRERTNTIDENIINVEDFENILEYVITNHSIRGSEVKEFTRE